MQTLYDKTDYICHYRSLKFYVDHGMVVKSLKKVLQFKQSRWMSKYIDVNTQRRKNSSTDCEKDSAKLFNNAVYGKSMEDLINRINLKLVSDEETCKKETAKPNFKQFSIFQPNLTAVTLAKTKITWNKPTFVGAAVLELSKLVMFNFYYNIMKPRYGERVHLLYSDTDSALLAVETPDIYEDIKDMSEYFDLSNYPPDHDLHSNTNELVVLKLKDELKGKAMFEYIGLKPKMYSMQCEGEVKQSCKGVPGRVKKDLLHETYHKVLENQISIRKEITILRSRDLGMFTERVNKTCLSCFDDKRYITGYTSIPYGHYTIPKPNSRKRAAATTARQTNAAVKTIKL